MFQFNFVVDENEQSNQMDAEPQKKELHSNVKPSKDIPIRFEVYKQIKPLPAFDSLAFRVSNTTDNNTNTIDNNTNNASTTFKLNKMKKKVALPETPHPKEDLDEIVQRSDLVPGIYEGGFKLWECSIDLIQYFVETKTRFDGMRILELGCGHGLPGILTLKFGAAQVYFQDFNEEVLTQLTMPNVFLNCYSDFTEPQFQQKTRFLDGDWSSVDESLTKSVGNNTFDVIMTCDTLYNPESYPKLFELFKNHIKLKTGAVFVAAKSYYFGIGGSVRDFEKMVLQAAQENSVEFQMTKAKVLEDNVSTVREILKIVRTL